MISTVKGPFNFWDKNGYLEFHHGNVRIYNVDGDQYLFVDQILYASTNERPWYLHNVMHYAKGRVLEIGLGLGCASKIILANNKVKHLLTLENNEGVIAAFGRPLPRHNVLHADIYDWVRNIPKAFPLYDLIFVDHYVCDEELLPELRDLATNLAPLVKEGGRIIFWVDENAHEELKEEIRKLWLIRE